MSLLLERVGALRIVVRRRCHGRGRVQQPSSALLKVPDVLDADFLAEALEARAFCFLQIQNELPHLIMQLALLLVDVADGVLELLLF